jgi:hypothetical protein
MEVSKIASLLSGSEKQYIIGSLNKEIEDELLKTIVYIINDDHSNVSSNTAKLFLEKKIVPVAKLNNGSPTIIVFKEKYNMITEVKLDRSNILSEIVPELGGIKYIASKISNDTSENLSNIENITVSQVLYFLQEQYYKLDPFLGTRKDGIFFDNGKVIAATNLAPSHRVHNGYVYLDSSLGLKNNAKRVSQKIARSAFEQIKEDVDGALVNQNTSIYLVVSSVIVDIVMPFFTPNISFSTNNKDDFELIKNGFFRNIFGYIKDLTGSSYDFIEASISTSSSPILMNNATKEVLELAEYQYRKKTFKKKKSHNNSYFTEKMSPVFIHSDKAIPGFLHIEAVVSSGLLDGIYAGKNTSMMSSIISHVVSNKDKIIQLTSLVRKQFQDEIRNSILSNSSGLYYVFETVLPALVLHSLLYSSNSVLSLLKQMIINHTNKSILKRNEVLSFVKKDKKKIFNMIYGDSREVIMVGIDIEDIVKSLDLVSINKKSLLEFLSSNSIKLIERSAFRNYKTKEENKTMLSISNKNDNLTFFLI